MIIVQENKLANKFPDQSFEERMGFLDELDEMAGLRKSDSGLPVNLWLDNTSTYIRGRHAKRIKFQNDYGNNVNENNLIPMLISKDAPTIPDKFDSKIRLSAKEINKIKAFVKNNANLLSQLADQKISFFTFCKRMVL